MKPIHWDPFSNHVVSAEPQFGESLSVVIPYRDREGHLKTLVPHLEKSLRSQFKSFSITIIEQRDALPFNKGRLLNIGARETNGEILCFHDVDFFPSMVNYRYPGFPYRPFARTRGHKVYTEEFCKQKLLCLLSSSSSKEEKESTVYPHCFGGVTLVHREAFFKVGGFSLSFPFWGFEDLDFLLRLFAAGYSPHYDPDGIFHLLPHDHVITTQKEKAPMVEANQKRFEAFSKKGVFDDGFAELEYTILERRKFYGSDVLSVA